MHLLTEEDNVEDTCTETKLWQEQRRLLEASEATRIQAVVRGHLGRLYGRVLKLQAHLAMIRREQARELEEITSWKEQQITAFRSALDREQQKEAEQEELFNANLEELQYLQRKNLKLKVTQTKFEHQRGDVAELNRLEAMHASTLACGVHCVLLRLIRLVTESALEYELDGDVPVPDEATDFDNSAGQAWERVNREYLACVAVLEEVRDSLDRAGKYEGCLHGLYRQCLNKIVRQVRLNVGADEIELIREILNATSALPALVRA